MESSWLCTGEAERQRLLDMVGRLRAARVMAFASMAVALLAVMPWMGPWMFIPFAAAAVVFRLTDRNVHQRRRPEYWMFAGWAFCQVMIAIAVVMSGGASSIFVMWLAVPTVTLAARFPHAGLRAGMALTALLMIGATVGTDPGLVADEPYRLVAPLSALIGIAALSRPLMASDLEHRAGASTDALTGLANRASLEREAPAILDEARRTGASVAVVIGDLDHFKQVNDRFGHDRGDAVLRDAAEAMRKVMRSIDRLYRLGGEEFLVLLPGADVHAAEDVGERLRRAVEECRPGGLDASITVGVSAGVGHEQLAPLYHLADQALYEGKRAGRNRVKALVAA
ncbi:MAG: GGDEF domain-containing protein [Solirubrobacterales bacterium]|nr:GGDEF domain-containing protein [Solirubrobacterales bacterium]